MARSPYSAPTSRAPHFVMVGCCFLCRLFCWGAFLCAREVLLELADSFPSTSRGKECHVYDTLGAALGSFEAAACSPEVLF